MHVDTRPATVAAVVCAYTPRRWDDTIAAVGSLLGQTRAPARVVLVIDHDEALLALARERFDPEPAVLVRPSHHTRGLSGARNTALDVLAQVPDAPGIVAFLDDDAVADPQWLARLLAHYDDPAVLAVGGRAQPRWPESGRPACLPGELWWVVGCSFTGQRAAPGVTAVRNLMGCAMSFRRAPVVAAGGFTETLGRVGTLPVGCEETELCIRLRRAHPDSTILLDPDAVVHHAVGPERTRWAYLLRRCWAEGRSKAAMTRLVGTEVGLAAERRYTRVVLPAALAREAGRLLRDLRRLEGRAVRRDLAGAAAIAAAPVTAAAGYLAGRVPRRARTPRPPDSRAVVLRRRTSALAALGLGVVACVAALTDLSGGLGGGVRLAATALFLLLGPGWAVAGYLRRAPGALSWIVAVAVGAAAGSLVSEAMALAGLWHPVAALYVTALVCAPVLVRHVVTAP